ncbi:MAG: SbcC/MukB-like Walker B domain-containing protein [Fusobacteriaceae bacterium]
MRPIKLEIEGLQSFREKQIINFEKLSEFGLFGIFGETGSGKSTILDAMIYAIYNKIPRMMGTTDKIEESFNLESDIMKIRFEFALGEDNYIIERGMRRAKGTKLFSVLTPVLLKNNEVVANKTKQIDSIIMEDFGIDVDDFTRSVILPQGKFSEFLKLTGQNKLIMLENIFSLEQYGDSLRDKVSKEKKRWESEIQSLKDRAFGKGLVTEKEIEETSNNLKKLENNKEEIEKNKIEFELIYKNIENLKNYIEEKKILDKKVKALKLEEKKFLDLENEINSLKKISKFSDVLTEKKEKTNNQLEIEKELILLEEKQTTLNLEFVELKKLIALEESNVNNIHEKLLTLNFNKELLEELKENIIKKERVDIYNSNIEGLNKQLLENENEKSQCEIKNKTINELLNEKRDKIKLEEKDTITEKELKELNEKKLIFKKDIFTVLKNENDLKNLKKNKPENILKLKEIKKILDMKLICEVELENKIEENRASIFSNKLIKGKPCPVCGSKEHPHKAEFDKKAEKILKELKTEIIKLREQETQLESKKNRIEEDILKLELEIKKYLENLKKIEKDEKKEIILGEIEIDKDFLLSKKLELKVELLEKNYEKLYLKHKNTEKLTQKLESEIIKLERDKEHNISEKDRIDSMNINLKNNLLKNLKRVEEIEVNIDIKYKKELLNTLLEEKVKLVKLENESNELEKEKKEIQDKFLENKNKLNEKNIEIIKINMQKTSELKTFENLERDILNLDYKINKLFENSTFKTLYEIEILVEKEKTFNYLETEEKIEKYKGDVFITTQKIEENLINIDSRKLTDEMWHDTMDKKDFFNREWLNINSAIQVEKKVLEDKKNIYNQLKDLILKEKKIQKKLDLAEDLLKKVSARGFVKFLSRKKLKSITKNASLRVGRITGGRYELISNADCEFLVIDVFNSGKERKCSTLSGGETFIVSLSLALALSNQLQLKGRTQLEFFFLDEGFGTLDESLLDKVIDSLTTIHKDEGIKVGIITHVENLKTRVNRRLEILAPIQGDRGSLIKLL